MFLAGLSTLLQIRNEQVQQRRIVDLSHESIDVLHETLKKKHSRPDPSSKVDQGLTFGE